MSHQTEGPGDQLDEPVGEAARAGEAGESLYRNVLDALRKHIAVLDRRGRIVAVNRAWRRFATDNGWEARAAGVGLSYLEPTRQAAEAGDAQAAEALSVLESVLGGDREEGFVEYPCPSPDGERWFRMRAARFDTETGGHVVVAHEDVTERVLADRGIRESEARLRAVLETAPQLIVISDGDGVVQFANRDEHDVSGMVGQSFMRFLDPDARQVVRRAIARARAGRTTVRFEVSTLPIGDLGARRYAVHCRALDEGGDHLVHFASDVTERQRLEEELAQSREQLRHSQKMEAVARLAGGVAHDFNNVLTAIRYFASAVAEELEEGTQARDDVAEIERAAEHATELTRQLLAFGRRQVLLPKVIDLNEKVREVSALLGRLIGENITLRTELTSGELLIEADPNQIEQILTNLVINARDAILTTGTITLRTHRAGASVVLEVADDGEGMDPDVRDRVFEPFFTTKGSGEGTGLGLATVHGIVGQHGGRIEVESELGQGTVFRVELPASRAETQRSARQHKRPSTRPGGHETILICEDDERLRRATVRLLGDRGFRTLEAPTVDAALEMGTREPIDLVLTDLLMPDGMGLDIAHALREQRPDLPVLLMTGYAPEDFLEEELREFELLRKPFKPRELVTNVRAALDAASERDASVS